MLQRPIIQQLPILLLQRISVTGKICTTKIASLDNPHLIYRYAGLVHRYRHHHHHKQQQQQQQEQQKRCYNSKSDSDDSVANTSLTQSSHLVDREQIEGHYNTDQYIGMEDDDDQYLLAPLVVCGPPGIGTRAIIKQFLKLHSHYFAPIISHTNRLPKRDEENGIDYHFISDKEMEEMIYWDDLMEHSTINGKIYGTSFHSILSVHGYGGPHRREILDMDMYGVKRMKEIANSIEVESTGYKMRPKYIFVAPPDLPTLRYRLQQRNTDTEEDIQKLLQLAETEIHFGMSKAFHARVYHITLDQAVQDFTDAVASLYESFDHILKHGDPTIPPLRSAYSSKAGATDDDDDRKQFRRRQRNQLIQSLDQDAIQPILPQDSRLIRQARRKAYLESQKQQQGTSSSTIPNDTTITTNDTSPPNDTSTDQSVTKERQPSSSKFDRANFTLFR